MKTKHLIESLSWTRLRVMSVFLCFTMSACFVAQLSVENRPCADGACLDGYECVNGLCVKAGETTPGDSSPADTTPADTSTDKPPTDKAPGTEPTPEDAGTVEKPADTTPPDEPVGPNCSNYQTSKEETSCTKNTGLACFKMSKSFQTDTNKLPEPISGAAATSNGESWKTINNDKVKVFLYIAGGGASGAPGNKTFFTEVDRNGKPLKWTAGPTLQHARTNAKANIINGYLYVYGGTATGQAPVTQVERAQIKQDGSLDSFADVGNLANYKAGMSIEYRHGFFYLTGGSSKTVERVLLRPEGKLGTPTSLPAFQNLPASFKGSLVSNHFMMFFLGTQGDNKIYFSRIQGNGELLGWCANTPIPKEVKEAKATLDGGFLILHNIVKSDGTLDARIFLSSLRAGSGIPRGGGLQPWICSDAGAGAAVLKRPRKGAAVAIARGHIYMIGGVDSGNTTLDDVEYLSLEYTDPTCDLDSDQSTNFLDNCARIYNKQSKSNLCDETMRLVPAGSFQRGDGSTDTPKKTITVDAVYVDATEVTNKQYRECVDKSVCTAPTKTDVGTITGYYSDSKYDNFPVVNITWKQAVAYCQWKGKRLPTEAEWEKAGRGLTGYLYPWGNESPDCNRANLSTCPDPAPKEVGIFPNGNSPYGIQNMAGNVREWVLDYFDKSYYKDGTETDNPKGPSQGQDRVIKGSSFKTTGANAYKISRRDQAKDGASAEDLGFRCAISVYPAAP
jgi:formylglycine-generating enzyme required for sulfatase activity